jgi:hypothetical protein
MEVKEALTGFEHERGHKPRNVGSLCKPEKIRKWVLMKFPEETQAC